MNDNGMSIISTTLDDKIINKLKKQKEKLVLKLVKIDARVAELEQQNNELIEFAKDNLKVLCVRCENKIIKNCICQMKEYNLEIIKKYGGE